MNRPKLEILAHGHAPLPGSWTSPVTGGQEDWDEVTLDKLIFMVIVVESDDGALAMGGNS